MDKLRQLTVGQLEQALKIRKRIGVLQQETQSMQVKLDTILAAASPRERAAPKVAQKKKNANAAANPAKKAVQKKAVAKKSALPEKAPGPSSAKKRPSLSLGSVITEVLTEANRPLNVDEIVAGIRKKGVKTKSKNPKHSISVKMYRDKSFKKAKRGYFTVAK